MRPLLSVLFCFIYLGLSAQFFLNGDAVRQDDQCYSLTPAINWKVGSIWNPDKINLNEDFDLVMEVFLGCQDFSGADGIVFGLQPVSTTIGIAGGGIGFQGVTPSLGIEIDTYQNTNLNDPIEDHIAIIRDGNLNHGLSFSNLAGPTQANANVANIEDCEWHALRVSWEADSKTLRVYFDCEQRLIYVGDIVNNIFGGDPLVFWGFTSATGGFNNRQEVCFSYSTFLDQIPDVVLCPGGQVTLEATGGLRYEWTPAYGLDNPTAARPIASPDTTTNYTVKIFDECDIPFYDEVMVTVAGDSVFFDLGPDTTLCEGEELILDVTTPTAVYNWNRGWNTGSVVINTPGSYAVTVTRTDTFCIADDRVTIDFLPLPELDLGPDLVLCQDQSINLAAIFPDAVATWSDGSMQDSFLVTSPGIYTVSLSHPCGNLNDQVLVDYEDCRQLFLPNIFSPNLDGVNDYFFPMDGGDVATIHLFQIYDRWGGMVFERTGFDSNVSNLGWDGQYRGRNAITGTYVWHIEVEFRDGVREQRTGIVHLLR